MKNHVSYILVLMICLIAVRPLNAQPPLHEPEMYIGAQAGVLASMVYFYPRLSQSALNPFWGANAGVVFRYNGHKYCGLQVELNYMQRGWKDLSAGEARTRSMDFLEIPLLTHIYFGNRYRGYINLGPQIGVLIRSEKSEKYTDYQYTEKVNLFDYGVTGGIGFYARTVAGVWQIESRFNYSLSNLFPASAGAAFANSNSMNLSLNFAYLWEFKHP